MKGRKMGGMHQSPSLIATSDGGVVILMGGKLAKYDKELNLVKEVEMKKPSMPPKEDGEMPVSEVAPEAPALPQDFVAEPVIPVETAQEPQ